MADKTTFTLNDSTIAQIAKCLQVAILTGTDIADNLRQLELELKEDNKIGVTDNYKQTFDSNIERLMQQVTGQSSDTEQLKLFE